MFLSKSNFSEVIKNAPLVSIDLCILKDNQIFLGKRINPPAKDFFFVPGGRILKSEPIKEAMKRILKNELGLKIKTKSEKSIQSLGTYEHFYEDNFLGNKDFGTHYIVLAYLIPFKILTRSEEATIQEQHSQYIWINIDNFNGTLIKIHKNSLEYMKNPIINNFKD